MSSLVKRVSRFTVQIWNQTKQARPVMDKVTTVIKSLPFAARRSITFDRGTEFVDLPLPQSEIGTRAWFCDPSAP